MSNGPFWITKYALSSGIEKIGSAETWQMAGGKDVYVRLPACRPSVRLGYDVFDNAADARADAEKRRQKKIASLKKQIAKLEKLTFGGQP